MWTVAFYQPTALFSLRPALSTASGGQTLVTPTPYAVKMALLDVAIRNWGLAQGRAWFPALRDLQVAVALPQRLVINNTFVKIQRLKKNGPSDKQGTGIVGPMDATIAFRAFVQFGGSLGVAVAPGEQTSEPQRPRRGQTVVEAQDPPPLAALLAQISYLGKRGGFMQLQAAPVEVDELQGYDGGDFVQLNAAAGTFPLDGLMQVVDDCGPRMEFAHADIFDPKSVQIGRERLLLHVALPYRLARSSQRYQLYERVT